MSRVKILFTTRAIYLNRLIFIPVLRVTRYCLLRTLSRIHRRARHYHILFLARYCAAGRTPKFQATFFLLSLCSLPLSFLSIYDRRNA